MLTMHHPYDDQALLATYTSTIIINIALFYEQLLSSQPLCTKQQLLHQYHDEVWYKMNRSLSCSQENQLEAPVTLVEIRKAVACLPLHKLSGADGLLLAFFRLHLMRLLPDHLITLNAIHGTPNAPPESRHGNWCDRIHL